jgi:uncharacterized sulfatase
MKRDLYEGGIRVPMVARWPGTVPPGVTSDHVAYFGDVFATLAELANQPAQPSLDSLSFLPTLTGQSEQQPQHDYLYWEFYEQGSKQAVRWKNWKAVRMPIMTGKTELYNIEDDLSETTNVAASNPDRVRQLEQMMNSAHVPDPNWKPRKR